MPNREQEVEDESNTYDNEPYQLSEIPIIQHDVDGNEESSQDIIGWCRGDMEGLKIAINVVEGVNLDNLEDDNVF